MEKSKGCVMNADEARSSLSIEDDGYASCVLENRTKVGAASLSVVDENKRK